MAQIENRRAYHDYEIIEKIEAGLELRGFEVKACKAGKASIVGSRVIIRGGEAYLVGALIQPYQPGNLPPGYEADRSIRLLLTRVEILRLAGLAKEKHLTLIPLKVYNSKGRLKLEVGVARGKKRFDKRETIKKRETDREIRRTLKNSG